MGAYNFKPRFATAVVLGEKTHTIRAYRRHMDVPGDCLHLFTGMRTMQCQRLGRHPAAAVDDVVIRPDGILIEGRWLTDGETDALAVRDGFPSGFGEMLEFWRGRLPFTGFMAHWRWARAGVPDRMYEMALDVRRAGVLAA
jgi:hypothetical protein